MSEGRDEKGKFTLRNMYHIMRERVGRPLKFESPEALADKALEYFEWSDECDKGKYTAAGMKLYIGATRQRWIDYKNRPDFRDTIDHIETILEDFNEKKLQWAGSTQGAIFWLKNKAGWKDENTVNQLVTEFKTKWAEPDNQTLAGDDQLK